MSDEQKTQANPAAQFITIEEIRKKEWNAAIEAALMALATGRQYSQNALYISKLLKK